MKHENKFDDVINRAKVALKVNSDAELAAAIGMSATAFSNRKKTQSIPFDKLTDLLKSRNVDFRWVFTGSVDITSVLRDASFAATEVALKYSPVGRGLLQEMQEAAFAEQLTSDQLQEPFKDRLPHTIAVDPQNVEEAAKHYADYQLVPRSSAKPSAGAGMLIESEQIVDYLAFKRDWLSRVLGITHNDIVLVEVRGDSMADTLQDGDLVLIDRRQNTLDVSAVFVLRVNDALLVKRVQHNFDGSVTIKSDNSRYDPVTKSGRQLKDLQIVGRVVWPRLR